jgi:phosphatidylinositol glycan class O
MKFAKQLIWVILISINSVCIFLIGFFLTRKEFPYKSVCNYSNYCEIDNEIYNKNSNISINSNKKIIKECCNNNKRYNKTLIFVVDALRIDFMNYSDEDYNNSNTSYSQFKYLHHLLQQNASQSHLFTFRADPPTTTSQRLKGITTGSLPTFIDISSNFNSAAINEDNIIDQLIQAQKRYFSFKL